MEMHLYTGDNNYSQMVQAIRNDLVKLATSSPGFTSVLMEGSRTFCVEAALTTAVGKSGKVVILSNGTYGSRMAQICTICGIQFIVQESDEMYPPDLDQLATLLATDQKITHVAVAHCETSTGMLNPIHEIGIIAKCFGKIYIVDAMTSFGSIPIDIAAINAHFLVSSTNKCIQGVTGFGFVIARRDKLADTRGKACSLSLDLFHQWHSMETGRGKWRSTAPAHGVRAFAHALEELGAQGAITKRHARSKENHRLLVSGMEALGFVPLLKAEYRSPIITSFHKPSHKEFRFMEFYTNLRKQGFIISPGKTTKRETFRIKNIGDLHPEKITRLLQAVERSSYWN